MARQNVTERPVVHGSPTAHLPWFLRTPRAGGLWLVGILIPVATLAGFVLSYIGLFDWASHHGWPLYLAPLFPLLIDLLIIAGEVVLFVAAIDGDTPWRVRAAAWVIVFAFTGLSVVGNVSHASTSDLWTRGGWGLPPVVLALALGFGLGLLKRQAAKYRTVPAAVPAHARPPRVPGVAKIKTEVGVGQDKARKVQRLIKAAAAPTDGGRDDITPSSLSVPATLNGHGGE